MVGTCGVLDSSVCIFNYTRVFLRVIHEDNFKAGKIEKLIKNHCNLLDTNALWQNNPHVWDIIISGILWQVSNI